MNTSIETYRATTEKRMGEKQRIVNYLNKNQPSGTRLQLYKYYCEITGDRINRENFLKRISDIVNDGVLVFTGKVVQEKSSYYEVLSHNSNGQKAAEKKASRYVLTNLVKELQGRNDIPEDLKQRVLSIAI